MAKKFCSIFCEWMRFVCTKNSKLIVWQNNAKRKKKTDKCCQRLRRPNELSVAPSRFSGQRYNNTTSCHALLRACFIQHSHGGQRRLLLFSLLFFSAPSKFPALFSLMSVLLNLRINHSFSFKNLMTSGCYVTSISSHELVLTALYVRIYSDRTLTIVVRSIIRVLHTGTVSVLHKELSEKVSVFCCPLL